MKEECKNLKEFKLRKQYSKNYQVVELEISGDPEDFDVAADWLDQRLEQEMKAIPEELLEKDNSGYKKPFKKQTSATKYTKQRKQPNKGAGTDRPFGSEKQWYHIDKEDNQEFLAEHGYTADELGSYQDLVDAIALLKDNGMLY